MSQAEVKRGLGPAQNFSASGRCALGAGAMPLARNPDDTESDDCEGARSWQNEASRAAGQAASPREAGREREIASEEAMSRRGKSAAATNGDPSSSPTFAEVCPCPRSFICLTCNFCGLYAGRWVVYKLLDVVGVQQHALYCLVLTLLFYC